MKHTQHLTQQRGWTAASVLLLLAGSLYAQLDRGQISGFVKDPSGAVVPAASVTFHNEATQQDTHVRTNESGYYQAPDLVRPVSGFS